MSRPRVLACLLLLAIPLAAAEDGDPEPRDDGYRGIWFTLGQYTDAPDRRGGGEAYWEYGDKYSGGLGTYTAKHVPIAVYAPEVRKTFFCYGGSRQGERYLYNMVSYYDHETDRVPRPVIVHDKDGVDDPHDNASLTLDASGHLWVYVAGRGRIRPGFVRHGGGLGGPGDGRTSRGLPVTGRRTALLALACGSALLPWCVSGRGEETAGTLELVAASAHRSVDRGAPLALTLTLRNAGSAPLELYHPESIHRMSPCWSLTGTVIRPGGDTVALAPEITFANVSVERREDFQHLRPGDAITVEIRLQADDPSATHTPSGWVGLIPLSRSEFEHLPEAAVKRRRGIDGEVYFISGSELHLALRDVLGDVFGQPGEYRLDFQYENRCTRYRAPSAGEASALKTVPGAWSGRLSATLALTIED